MNALDGKTVNDIQKVIDYLWQDEERHYQEEPCKGHIFLVMKRLAKKITARKKAVNKKK